MAAFKAIVIEKAESGTRAALTDFDEANLMDGDVTVRVEYSTINYKDGLAITGKAPVVRRFPMIAGIDFAGTVEASTSAAWEPGDKVVLNGWGCGETHLGAYAEKSRVKGDWLVPLPKTMSTREAMAIGTAGYTAMLAVMALERHGVTPSSGPIAVTGAAGGVGSVAIAVLSKRGFAVHAVTGRPQEADYLKGLGATEIVERKELAGPAKPLAKERWAGAIDAVGSTTLANSAVHDPLWRSGSRVRACRRHGSAGVGCPVHFAGSVSLRHRLGDVPARPAQGSLETAGNRPGSPKTGHDDPGNRPFGRIRGSIRDRFGRGPGQDRGQNRVNTFRICRRKPCIIC